ncbi:19201_t:CDS:2, partial [Racocetra fulgida]
ETTHLSIEDLANWLANPKIKNNPTIINKKVPKTDAEWFDLMEKTPSRSQKKTPTPAIIDQRDESKDNPKDIDKKVFWPVLFPDDEMHQKVWQKGIQTAKDMFKVDGAEYTFSTWFAIEKEEMYEAGMTKERVKKILNAIDDDRFLIRVKFIRPNNDNFKIIDKYEPIRESKKADKKFVPGGPNVILTKKMKPGFWVGIDRKFLVREIQIKSSDFKELTANAPDSNRLMPMKDDALNCVAQRVIEHFEKAKRGYGLTNIRKQKISTWEKRMRQPGARVEDVVELERILKRPIKLLDITHRTIFNSGKYRTGRFEEIEIIQSISQFVLEDGRIFRTWMKHTDIIKAYKELFEDAVDWQFQEGIISEEKKQESLESLKIVELAEQVFEANHAGSKLANEINDWHPTPVSVHENIKQSCVEHGHEGRWNASNYQIRDVRFGHPTHHLVRVAVNGELPQDDITRFAQIRSFKFVPNIHSAIPVWYRKHFACRSGEGCGKAKGWTPIVLLRYLLEAGILESITIGEGKFTQGNKVEEKRLTHRVVIDEGELDFLIQDCIKEGTYAGSDKCPLGHILIYYEGHQPQYTHLRASMLAYAHINLLEMLRRFGPNEVQVKQKISYPKDSVNTKLVKVFQKTKMLLAVGEYFPCSKHKPFVCYDCFWDWYVHKGFWEVITDKKPSSNTSIAITKISEPLKEKILSEPIREIQPGQWRDKGEKIYGPDPNVVYWPKNRHWESIKNITKSTAPSIHDPITRSRVSYLNGGGGSEKTTRAIRIIKDINMVVFTHTNVLAKDFQNDRKEVLTNYRAKCPRLQELKKKMRCQNNRVQSDLFREALPVAEK